MTIEATTDPRDTVIGNSIEEKYAETRRQVRARLYARDWNPIRVGLIARIQSIVLARGGAVRRWCA